MKPHSEMTSPAAWNATFSSPPVFSTAPQLMSGGSLRRWCGTADRMEQPALDHHLVVVHLGGGKRVERCGEGGKLTADVEPGSITVSPAGSAYSFKTEGPIDFAHLYISPQRFDEAVEEVFGREPASVRMHDRLGVSAPFIAAFVRDVVCGLDGPGPNPPRLYFEALFESALLRLIVLATDATRPGPAARLAIAPHRLRRVHAFIESHVSEDIDLQALADVAGLSKFHFCRAFSKATGRSPHAYVSRLRIERAKLSLATTTLPVAEIGRSVGFRSAPHFSATFKRLENKTPREWRRGC